MGSGSRLPVVKRLETTVLICVVLILGAAKAAQAADCVPDRTAQPPTGSSLPQGQVGKQYFTSFQMTSGVLPFTVSSSPSAPLPLGLSVGSSSLGPSTFNIYGTPQEATVGSTFIINVQDHTGCTTDIVYAIEIIAASACNPPLTLKPSGGTLQPGTASQGFFDSISVFGGTGPYTSEISGNPPPGMISSVHDAGPDVGPVPQLELILLSGVGTPGTYTFTVTVTDSRGCKATATYTITLVDSGAPCTMQLKPPPDQSVRVNSNVSVTATAVNIGSSSCMGSIIATFLPPAGFSGISTIPGSAFPIFCNLVSGQEHCGGAGTIAANGFVGVTLTFNSSTPGTFQMPFTLQSNTGPTQNDSIDGTQFSFVLAPRQFSDLHFDGTVRPVSGR